MSGTLKLKKQNPNIEREKKPCWYGWRKMADRVYQNCKRTGLGKQKKVKITDDKAVYPETGEIPRCQVTPRPDKFIVE